MSHGDCCLDVKDFSYVQQKVEICESTIERLSLVFGEVAFVLGRLGWRSSVVGREISNLENAVIFLFVSLTGSELHNKEELVELLYVLALHHDGRHHLIWLWGSNAHLFAVLRLSENLVSFKSLSHVRDHVRFEIGLAPLVLFNDDSDLF